MDSPEQKRQCDQRAQDTLGSLVACWGNQLERIQQLAERIAMKASTSSQSNGKFRIEPGSTYGN